MRSGGDEEDKWARLDGLLDDEGALSESDQFDAELLGWFETETGLVLPADFCRALVRRAGFRKDVIVAVPFGRRWATHHHVDVGAPVFRDPETNAPRLSLLRKWLLAEWDEREPWNGGDWFRARRRWAEEQLWPFASNSQVYFCFDFRYPDPPVILFDSVAGLDSAGNLEVPVRYVAPSFTAMLEQAAGWYELELTPYEPTQQQLAWERAR